MRRDNGSSAPIGLLAGRGGLPLVFAKAAASLKKRIVLIGIEGLTDKETERFTERAHYLALGTLDRLPALLKEAGIKEVVLAGSIPKREIYNPGVRLDQTAAALVRRVDNKGDDHFLRAFQVFLKIRCGVSVVDSRLFLKDVLARKGIMTKRRPAEREWKDLRFGWKIAKGVGKLDIGQTVVVKDGIVLAVEALEGTDAAIRRGSELGRGGAVVVKAAKPNQDLRFDLPCVGLQTLESLKEGQSRALGVEAGKTVMVDKERFLETADGQGVSIVGF